MKAKRLPILALAALLAAGGGVALASGPERGAAVVPAPERGGRAAIPYGPGERLKFGVKFKFVRAGNAELSVVGIERVDGEQVLHFRSTATSSRFFSTFYRVENVHESFWSLARQVPLRYVRHVREGKYEKDETIRFLPERNLAVRQDGKEMHLLPGAQDILSAFYYVRGLPLEVGRTVLVPNHANGKNYTLHVNVLRRETVKVEAGKFRCVVIEPRLETEGVFKQKGTLTIWLTDDARRMPVRMASKISVGEIVAELEEFRLGAPVDPLAPEAAASGPAGRSGP